MPPWQAFPYGSCNRLRSAGGLAIGPDGGDALTFSTYFSGSTASAGTAPFTVSATPVPGLQSVSFRTHRRFARFRAIRLRFWLAAVILSGLQSGDATYAAASATQSFTVWFNDVSPTDSDYAAIDAMAQPGITSGCSSDGFCPNLNVTRDEMAIFIVRAIYGSDNFTYTTAPYFTDATAASEFALPWIQRMKLDSITNGCTVTTYCGTAPVTRGQMAIFIMRGAFNQFLPAGTPVIASVSPATLAAGTSGTLYDYREQYEFRSGFDDTEPDS